MFNAANAMANGGAGAMTLEEVEARINQILQAINQLPRNRLVNQARNIKKERNNAKAYNEQFGPSQLRRQMIRNREMAFRNNLRKTLSRREKPPQGVKRKYHPSYHPGNSNSENNLTVRRRRLLFKQERAADTAAALPSGSAKKRAKKSARTFGKKAQRIQKLRIALVKTYKVPSPTSSGGQPSPPYGRPVGMESGVGANVVARRDLPTRSSGSQSSGQGSPRRRPSHNNASWSAGSQGSAKR
jgi:hypothetical protein